MLEQRPKLIVTEYDLDPMPGLALVELMEKLHKDQERISIIVARNSADSVVAEAAEGAVDAFLVKPFSPDALHEKLKTVMERKLNPSPYLKKLSDGQNKIMTMDLSEALKEFIAAKTLDATPTLACYFTGQTFQRMGDLDSALKEYREGRRYQPLHYKCLIGEYEAMMIQEKYADAYNLVPLIRANYPISWLRLAQICTSAVFSYHFDDLPDLYDLFIKMDNRPEELTDMIALALYSGGRYWMKKNDKLNAMSFFNMAVTTKGRDIRMIEKIVNELLRVGAVDKADEFFAKILPSDVGSVIHSQLSFRLLQNTLPPDQVLESGRKLVFAGHGTPEIYKTLVEMSVQAGKTTLAETIIQHAVKDDPSLKDPLYALFSDKKIS